MFASEKKVSPRDIMRPVRPGKTPKKTPGKNNNGPKDPIVVCCRIRPLPDPNEAKCVRIDGDARTVIFTPSDSFQNGRNMLKELKYSFSRVFDENTSQKEVFENAALPLVQDVLDGSNGLLFTYGITSSGKTHTMTGTPEDCGILPRCLDIIFNSIVDFQADKYLFKPDKFNGFDVQTEAEMMLDQQKDLGLYSRTPKAKRKELCNSWSGRIPDTSMVLISSDSRYAIFVSYVEIYNNYIYDLLEDSSIDLNGKKSLNSKVLREDAAHNTYVFGIVENEVKNVDEALQLFYKGQQRRKIANTTLNRESSRSHSVFTIRIVQAPLDSTGCGVLQSKDHVTISQLSLVDLAGSERPVRTKNTGLKLREAGNINNSLMALRLCIEALRESQTQACSKVVAYRESKLTHLFKTFFEGEGKITMIVCVNPKEDNADETMYVMKFAETTQEVYINRPTPVATPNALQLKPGRGLRYNNALKQAKEHNMAVDDLISPTVFALGPEFPEIILTGIDDDEILSNLIEFLNSRIVRRSACTTDLCRRQMDFRQNLQSLEKDIIKLRQEKTILQMDLNAREQQVQGLERKLSSTEQTVDAMDRQLNEYKQRIDAQRLELGSKERQIVNLDSEVGHIKTRMQEKLASEKDRMKRIMERRLAAKQAELERKMCFTDERFRQLREILNADDWEFADVFVPPAPPSTTSTVTSESSSAPESRRTRRRSYSESKFTKPKSVVTIDPRSSKQKTNQQNDFDTLYAKENKAPGSSQRAMAISNLRHRRSQSSSGDVWLEHKPIGNLELNTVLQPTMKKKKSVTKLSVKDVTNDVSKYVLQHQEQDSQGEVETQLYKGDIIPSAGGGAQVVFNDVEKLKQASPPSSYNLRKRSGESLPLRSVEDRCTVAVECHGLPSKVLRKK